MVRFVVVDVVVVVDDVVVVEVEAVAVKRSVLVCSTKQHEVHRVQREATHLCQDPTASLSPPTHPSQ